MGRTDYAAVEGPPTFRALARLGRNAGRVGVLGFQGRVSGHFGHVHTRRRHPRHQMSSNEPCGLTPLTDLSGQGAGWVYEHPNRSGAVPRTTSNYTRTSSSRREPGRQPRELPDAMTTRRGIRETDKGSNKNMLVLAGVFQIDEAGSGRLKEDGAIRLRRRWSSAEKLRIVRQSLGPRAFDLAGGTSPRDDVGWQL